MNKLAQTLQDNAIVGTPTEIRSILDSDTFLKEDPTLYTVGQFDVVLTALDPVNSTNYQRLVIGTIKAAADQDPLVWGYAQKLFAGDGIPFNLPNVQNLIDQLAIAGSWPDAVRDCIKGIGIINGKIWQKFGLPSLPEESDITIALNQIETSNWIKVLLHEQINPSIESGVSLTDLKTLIKENT